MKEPELPNRVRALLNEALIAKANQLPIIDAADLQEDELLNFNPLVHIAESLQQAKSMLEKLHEMKATDPEAAKEIDEAKQMMQRRIRILQQDWHDEFDSTYPPSN